MDIVEKYVPVESPRKSELTSRQFVESLKLNEVFTHRTLKNSSYIRCVGGACGLATSTYYTMNNFSDNSPNMYVVRPYAQLVLGPEQE